MPTIVLCDVAAWSLQNLAECEHDELMAKIEVCECCEIDQATARAAATLPIGLPGVRTSDELSYALARLRGLQMLTCNPLLEGLPNVIYRGPALILAQSEDRVH
ncbi:hypothetical protein CDL60_10675 [Roseateles noduli]|nr:hypothetical protein CDL60_10675 [Roseateles noduli]